MMQTHQGAGGQAEPAGAAVSRRAMLAASAAGLGLLATAGVACGAGTQEAGGGAPGGAPSGAPTDAGDGRSGRLRQSVARWAFSSVALPELCRAAREMGLQGVDLLQPDEWAVARDHGLVCSMGYPADRRDFITTGFNDRANHPMLLRELERTVPRAAAEGVPNVIGMFGNRNGTSDDEARDACVEGLRRIAPLLEQHEVTLCLELLNSKVDHAGYQGDRTAFGASVIRLVGSDRVKLLYDIYHMQIMEGDVIRTIDEHRAEIAHFHTAGVPGRHEIGDRQELYYPAIARAIADAGFDGFVAHEFVPTGDPLGSLAAAVRLCTV